MGKSNRIEKDGFYAVLYSPGYGSGWSTWNQSEMTEVLCTHPDIVQCVLDGNNQGASVAALSMFPDKYVCVLGARDLRVKWIEIGYGYDIEEYDGSERIEQNYEEEYAAQDFDNMDEGFFQ